jgi:hypothetical protein
MPENAMVGLRRSGKGSGSHTACIEADGIFGGAGGRDKDRTCDPYDVNVVLSR